MINKSVWQKNFENYPQLINDIERETVIIGGGIAGFLTAFRLSEEGAKVTLIEADKIFSGTTSKTTGKISCNQEAVYFELYKKYGKETAKKYYLSQKNAQRGYLELIEKYNIDCDLVKADSYIFTSSYGAELKADYRLLITFGADCEWIENFSLFNSMFALRMKDEYMFDVLKFASALPKNFEIYEHTRAVKVDCGKNLIITEKAKIKAKNIIIATRYPIIDAYGGYIYKLRQSQSYLVAVKNKLTDDMYLDLKKDGLTMRPYLGGTLIGGEDNRTGRCSDKEKFRKIKEKAERNFRIDESTHIWSAEDVMTADGMPMAGKYWNGSDNIFVITGFNKWGMTNSLACANLICDMLLKRKNGNEELFAPNRKIKGSFSEYTKNAVTTFKNVVLGYCRITFENEKSLRAGDGKVIRYKGKKRAVYKDENGKLYVIGSMCPHLHGELKWNSDSCYWECPCHGSQFDIYGKVISAPSTKHCKSFEK